MSGLSAGERAVNGERCVAAVGDVSGAAPGGRVPSERHEPGVGSRLRGCGLRDWRHRVILRAYFLSAYRPPRNARDLRIDRREVPHGRPSCDRVLGADGCAALRQEQGSRLQG